MFYLVEWFFGNVFATVVATALVAVVIGVNRKGEIAQTLKASIIAFLEKSLGKKVVFSLKKERGEDM